MPARLTHVAIKDYRSIGSCDVELQPLTLLVGPNGSGKSNFLDALRFLRESMSSPLHQVAASRFGILSLLRWLPGGGLADSFTITIRFKLDGNKKGTYTLSVAEGPHNSAVIREELCRVGDDWFSSVSSNITPVPRSTGDRPRLASLGALPQFAPVFNLIDGFRFYEPNPTSMRPPLPIGPGDMLAPNAANVADVYARLRSSHPELIERIHGYLQSFTPEFRSLGTTEFDNYRRLKFVPSANPAHHQFNNSQVSDGTLRAVAILIAIFQSPATTPLSLIGLEEPESNLHPAAAGVLLDALLEASRRTPIIASTHSADLLDRRGLPENAILAFSLHDGETIIGPVDAAGKEILHKRLYTAGELLRSNQLNPELPTPRT